MDFQPTNFPIENEFPKLIRDKIPDIIALRGAKANTQTLASDEEYLMFLLKKMLEEATELQHSEEVGNMQEELADVLEIIQAIVKLKNWTMEEIVTVQKEKREKNGGFEKRILMLSKE